MTDPVDETDVMARLPVLGYLTYREWHAFVDGFYVGATAADVDADADGYDDSRHYWRVGWLVGRALADARE